MVLVLEEASCRPPANDDGDAVVGLERPMFGDVDFQGQFCVASASDVLAVEVDVCAAVRRLDAQHDSFLSPRLWPRRSSRSKHARRVVARHVRRVDFDGVRDIRVYWRVVVRARWVELPAHGHVDDVVEVAIIITIIITVGGTCRVDEVQDT